MRADQATEETSDDEKISNRKLSSGSPVSEQSVLRSADDRGSIAPSVQRQGTNSGGVGPSSSGPATRGEYEQRYRVSIDRPGQADRLQRLEASNSLATVQRWADEGLPIEAMGTPSKMDAYRKREGTPVPWNVEQQNKQSLQRSKRAAEDTSPAGETNVPESVRDVVSSPGKPVDTALRKPVESEIGQSLDHARVHRSPAADAACEQLNARAFTVNNHVAVRSDQPDPSTPAGQHLMSHELTHVAQQTGSAISLLPDAGALEVDPDPQLEQEAEETAQRVMQGGELGIQRLSETDVHVQRMPGSGDVEEGGVSSDQANSTRDQLWQYLKNLVQKAGTRTGEMANTMRANMPGPRQFVDNASAGYISALASEIQEVINKRVLRDEPDNPYTVLFTKVITFLSAESILTQENLRRDTLKKELETLAGKPAVDHWAEEIINEVNVPNQTGQQEWAKKVRDEAWKKLTQMEHLRNTFSYRNRWISHIFNSLAGLAYDRSEINETGLLFDTIGETAGMAEAPTPLEKEVTKIPVPEGLKRSVAAEVRKKRGMSPSSPTISPKSFGTRSLDWLKSIHKYLPLHDVAKWVYTMANWLLPRAADANYKRKHGKDANSQVYFYQAVVDSLVEIFLGEVLDYLQLVGDLELTDIPKTLRDDLVDRVSTRIAAQEANINDAPKRYATVDDADPGLVRPAVVRLGKRVLDRHNSQPLLEQNWRIARPRN